MLVCPVCRAALIRKEKSAVCKNGHSFDYAKDGYLNLLISNKANHGDNMEMVQARTAFLSSGAYSFLRDAIVQKTSEKNLVYDLGCGEGYYTSQLKGKLKYGFDMSKRALRYASKHDGSTQYILASIFNLPVDDASATFCLTCFAPAAVDEIERVLKPGGKFLFVTPGPKHLWELKELLYEHPYENKIQKVETSLSCISDEIIEQTMDLKQDDLLHLFAMTPYAYKTGMDGMAKLKKCHERNVTAQFHLRLYQKL